MQVQMVDAATETSDEGARLQCETPANPVLGHMTRTKAHVSLLERACQNVPQEHVQDNWLLTRPRVTEVGVLANHETLELHVVETIHPVAHLRADSRLGVQNAKHVVDRCGELNTLHV